MEKSWIKFLENVYETTITFEENGCDIVCFRGHSNSSWDLEPTLLVQKKKLGLDDKEITRLENIVYFDFVTNAGNLITSNLSDWEILFLMRHHSIPTRILDWTESFGTALFFALSGDNNSPTIWILDPFKLNKITYKNESIPNPMRDLKFGYEESYIKQNINPFVNPIAMIPPRNSDRIFAQKGLFTLQGSNNTPLNKVPELIDCFKKIEIPIEAIPSAKRFLKLFGINNYSIFPDLDGLSKYLTERLFN